MTRRRDFLAASFAAAAAPAPASAATRARMRGIDMSRQVDIWRSPGRFTKNPDIIRFASGKLMLVFCDVDRHWSEEISRITVLESTDAGRTWGKPRVVAQADRRKGEERWVTPRLSLLRDGRAIVVCDHDDYSHCHEDQPSGIWMWESRDEGSTWSEPKLTGIPGIEPDRIIELDDGTLLMGSHMTFRANRKIANFVMRSTDGGKTWRDLRIIAQDKVHHHCEGGLLTLKGGRLACILRENNHNGYPSYVSFSNDKGRTWSKPGPMPFSGDRPYAKQLRDGRVLVTYRNQNGNRGTHAWIGNLDDLPGYQIGGVHYGDEVSLANGVLKLGGGQKSVTRYVMMPPESSWSDVMLETVVSVSGPAGQPIGTAEVSRLGLRLDFCADALLVNGGTANQGIPSTDRRVNVDFTKPRTVRLDVIANRVAISVDGKHALNGVIYQEQPLRETWFGRSPESRGDVSYRRFAYEAKNMTEPPFSFKWNSDSGSHPDQYQIDNTLELMANPPVNPGYPPDNGYSSWIEREDGSIYFVDYTNRGDPKPASHLYKVEFSPEDFVR